MKDLQDIRKKIDEVDNRLLEIFEERMQLAHSVAEYKKSRGLPVYDRTREEEKLAALKDRTKHEKNKALVMDLFSQIMAMSRRVQHGEMDTLGDFGFIEADQIPAGRAGVVYYGETGSYTEAAMLEYFKGDADGIPLGTFREVMQALKEQKAEYGVLPMENSSTGTLTDSFDLLAEYDNYIIGEHVIRIDHNLWGLPEAGLSDIRTVYSHRQGLLQCSSFLNANPEIRLVEGGSTAGCARRIVEEGDITRAAIASRRAGETYGLKLLKASIHNDRNNSTRFIIISNKRIYYKGARRISLCFVLPHKSGSLYHMLSHFIHNNINMTRIESRPIQGKAFEYRFFVDIEGNLQDPSVKNALLCIREEALEMKILGSFNPV